MDGSNAQTTIRIVDGPSAVVTSPDVNIVGPGYFSLLDIPIRQGREFSSLDHESAPAVAVVNEKMATQYWNGEPVGRTFMDDHTGKQVQIVGVARDLRHRSFGEPPLPMIYFCANQRYRPRMTLHVRTAVPRGALGPVLQRTLHDTDRTAGHSRAETMYDYFDRVTLPQRIGAGAAVATGGLELALAIMALYGVIAFAASQRTREIGVRMALGASNRSVIALIMREGLLLTVIGVVLGTGAALIGGAALSSLLIGIEPSDPVSFGVAIPTLLLVGALASYVPARRASSVDPSVALRSE
jgi:hypothetical protein